MRKEVWFGLSIMAAVVITVFVLMPPPSQMTNGHLGLLMLAMIVVGIMLGFPTAFTLMGMGVFFGWLAYHSVDPGTAERRVLDLFVQRTYGVMSNDVLIAIPLFLFMGYLVERAQLIDRLFRSLHLATARIPGALAVATIVTCAIFAGGCLGILIPPSVLLIVYGAVAGVSVVQLYAGAFLPGIMLAGLYIGYIILLAAWKPHLMPPLAESERRVELPPFARKLAPHGSNALTGLWRVLGAGTSAGVAKRTVLGQLFVTLLPALFIAAVLGVTYRMATAPEVEVSTAGLIEAGGLIAAPAPEREASTDLIGAAEPEEKETSAKEPPAGGTKEASPAGAGTEKGTEESPGAVRAVEKKSAELPAEEQARLPVPLWLWIVFGIGIGIVAVIYLLWNWERLEVFKMLLTSFFPLALLIIAVLGSIVFGLATPSEAAAVGGFGGFVLAAVYRFIGNWRETRPGAASRGGVTWKTVKELGSIVKESSFLTAKTSAMVCWLFVGSGIFSAAFALLGGQKLIERWV